MMRNRLKIGVLIDSYNIPHWAFHMLEEIQKSHYAQIVLLIKNEREHSSRRSLLKSIQENFHRLLYIGFMKLEQRVFHNMTPDAFEKRNISHLLPDVPCLRVTPRQQKFSDYFRQDDIETIREYKPDVLIRLGFRILRGEILHAAKYGIWSYHHGDNTVNRGGPACFWEVFEGQPVTGSILQILTEDLDDGLVLYRSYSHTDQLSVKRGKNSVFWKTLYFLPRKLEELYTVGEKAFFSKAQEENQHPVFYSGKLYITPTNRQFVRLALKHYSTYLLKKIKYLCSSYQWILLFRLHSQQRLPSSFWRFKKIIPPKDRFWADPFVVSHEETFYVFIEEFLYHRDKGHIAYFTIDKQGKASEPKKIIEQPYHLSYPFVFTYNNTSYLIPESSQNRTIELYQCQRFPEKWERIHVLMENVEAFDTTLFRKDGTWFLFTNIRVHAGASSWDELFLFYSTELLSDRWTAHPQNPIVSDAGSARPAGRIFSYHNNLYRPSQNNTNGYGYGMKINQILTLTETDYQEVCVNEILPNWDRRIVGTHTLNSVEHLTVIDGLLQRPKLWS